MKKLTNLEMLQIKGGGIPRTEFIGSFEIEGSDKAEYFYRRPDGTVYSVIR